jgi:hypothetical protein
MTMMSQFNVRCGRQHVEDDKQLQPAPPQRILDLFFRPVQRSSGKLDDYRAGYFDKILSVCFGEGRPVQMVPLSMPVVLGRPALMRAILNHLFAFTSDCATTAAAATYFNECGRDGEKMDCDELLSDAELIPIWPHLI